MWSHQEFTFLPLKLSKKHEIKHEIKPSDEKYFNSTVLTTCLQNKGLRLIVHLCGAHKCNDSKCAKHFQRGRNIKKKPLYSLILLKLTLLEVLLKFYRFKTNKLIILLHMI